MSSLILMLCVFLFIAISIGYYYDYKKDAKDFVFSLKMAFKGFAYIGMFIGVFMGIHQVYELLIPWNTDHGVEFNEERKKRDLPKLGTDWTNAKFQSDQFSTYWWKPEPRNGHFKKVIAYGLWDIQEETNYYYNEKRKGTFAWSVYNFESNTFTYFIEKPNGLPLSYTTTGRLKKEKRTHVEKLTKLEFEAYTTE